VFLERDPEAIRALRDNLARLGLEERARVVRDDATRALDRLLRAGEHFAVVFLDPPYDGPHPGPLLRRLAAGGLAPGGVVVLQHATKSPALAGIPGFDVWRTRRFGETTLTFFRAGA